MPFLLAEILNFQGSTHLIGVGSLSKLLKLEKEREQVVPNTIIKLSTSILELMLSESSVGGAAAIDLLAQGLQGEIFSLGKFDGYVDQNTKLGMDVGNVIYTSVLNGYTDYENADIALKTAEWCEFLSWFGKGGTYNVVYEDEGICLPTQGISFAGAYEPDVLRAMEDWKENGMSIWIGNIDKIEQKEAEIIEAGVSEEVYESVLYGETIARNGDALTMEQFCNAMNVIGKKSNIEDLQNIFDEYTRKVD